MSEFDSLSDSDWQEVASGRYSDVDSLSEPDSDRDEINSMPRSRRSSISNADSLSSDMDCWQGLVSDSGDDGDGMYPVQRASPIGAEPTALGLNPDLNEVVDPLVTEEDQMVKEVLDQSFVGTLNASRSSNAASAHSPSVHNSIRDLRLSFPDPLTSSRDELNRSYDAIYSPTETTISSSIEDDVNDSEAVSPIIAAPPVEDQGTPPVTPEVRHHEVQHFGSTQRPELQIVLYGSSSEIKWQFIQDLIQKAAGMSGHVLTQTHEKTQSVHLISDSEENVPFFNNIKIDDCTPESATMAQVDYPADEAGHPSLAIVYLPTAKLPVLSLHNAYLPVLTPSITDTGDTLLQAAEDDWELLGVPESRTLKLGTSKSPVFDAQELSCISPTHAYKALHGIDRNAKKITGTRPLTEQAKSVNAVTLFALMSIIMGFALNTAFRPATPSPTPTTNTPSSSNGHLWGIFAPQPNRSILAPSSAKGADNNNIGVSPSLKDMAISVFNAGSTSLSVTSAPSSVVSISVASNSKGTLDSNTKYQHCGSSSKSCITDKARATTDIVLRSTTGTSLTTISQGKPSGFIAASSPDKQSGTTILLSGAERIPKSTVGITASATSSLSFNSVSEVFDATTKALTEAMGSDLAEFVEVADELLLSIRKQTDTVSRQWKGKARAIGEQLQNLNEEVVSRHERAKMNARAFGKKAGEIVRGATEELRAGTGRAQKRARKQMQSIVEGGAEAWKTYERTQEEWGVLSGKANIRGREKKNGKSDRARDKYGKENDWYPGKACLKGSRRLLRNRRLMKGGRICNDI